MPLICQMCLDVSSGSQHTICTTPTPSKKALSASASVAGRKLGRHRRPRDQEVGLFLILLPGAHEQQCPAFRSRFLPWKHPKAKSLKAFRPCPEGRSPLVVYVSANIESVLESVTVVHPSLVHPLDQCAWVHYSGMRCSLLHMQALLVSLASATAASHVDHAPFWSP